MHPEPVLSNVVDGV